MPSLPLVLKLRPEIVSRGALLHDDLTGAAYPLDPLGQAIVEALKTPRTAAAIASHLAAVGRFRPDRAGRELRRMLLLAFFEQTGETYRKRLERLQNGELPAARVLEGSRFGCQGSGACCQGYVFGYISPAEKARIEALNPHKALAHLGDRPIFITAQSSAGHPVYRLATKDDACIFLEDQRRCGLHRVFGADAKPAFCRLYPLAAIATIDGLKVYDRGECSTFAVSANTGKFLSEDLPTILSLADKDIYHPAVQIHGVWRCDYGPILALAHRMDLKAIGRSPLHALHAIGQMTRRFIMALVRCPFEAGQPELAVADALKDAVDLPSDAAIAANARTGLQALATLAGGMVGRVAASERLGQTFEQMALVLAEVCRDALGTAPLSEARRAELAAKVEEDSEQAMRLSLRQQIFGRELLLNDQLPAGLLRMAFVVLMTLTGARLQAFKNGAGRVSPQHFSLAHMTARRILHRPGPHALLWANGEHAWPILDALPRLAFYLGWAGDGGVQPAEQC